MQTGRPDKSAAGSVSDAQQGNWVDNSAPEFLKPYARLARWDRPIGFWLLFWPCAFSIGLADAALPIRQFDWMYVLLFLIGAVAMRGAGCTFNDIVDRDIDEKIARTRSRPLPSGAVKLWQAVAFLALQALVGLWVLLQFNMFTVWLGIASLVLVVIYPFMKRVTWWPQLFLGLAFSWGALMGWAAVFSRLDPAPMVLYVGSICWVIAYDTIYALQDLEDDALVGVKSTARLFGSRARQMVALFFAAGFSLWIAAALMTGAGLVFLVAALPAALILIWQVVTLNPENPGNCMVRFRANHWVGLALMAAFVLEWWL